MKTKVYHWLPLATLVSIVSVLGFDVTGAREGSPPPNLEGVKEVIFTPSEKELVDLGFKFSVSNSKEVREILSSLDFVPKRPCTCAYEWTVTFVAKEGSKTASFSGHCFSFHGGGMFRNTEQFHKLFKIHLAKSLAATQRPQAEQDGPEQAASAVDSKSEGDEKPKPDSEERSQ